MNCLKLLASSGLCAFVAGSWPLQSESADFARNFGTVSSLASAYATTVDQAGNSYLGGYFEETRFAVGTMTLVPIGVEDAFVAKLDPLGNASWAVGIGGIGARAAVYALAADRDGNVHVAGSFRQGSLTKPALPLLGATTMFVLKLDPSGSTMWARAFGGSTAVMDARGIAVDAAGNVHVSGYLSDGNSTAPPLTRLGTMDAFVLKLDASGNTVWARNFGGPGAVTFGGRIAQSGQGMVVTGHFWEASLTSPALSRAGTSDAFALKLDASGNIAWARSFGGPPAVVTGGGVAVDGSGNVWLCGSFESGDLAGLALRRTGTQDTYVTKLDASGGTLWAKSFGGSGNVRSWCSELARGPGGGVLAAGGFKWGNLTTPALPKIGIQDAFVMHVDDSGRIASMRSYGGSLAETWAIGLAADDAGNFVLGGNFAFGDMHVPALARIGFRDAFIIRQAAGNAPGALSGLWWNASESGWGVHFTQRRNVIFAAWYTYDANGAPKWYVASSCTMSGAEVTRGTCSGVLYEASGPSFFGLPFNPNAVNVVTAGSLSISFQDADYASMSYTIGSQSRTVALTRQPISSGSIPKVNYTDLWWNPSESGWGMAVSHQASVMFLAWYVYDSSGKPMWYVASNCAVSGSGCTGTLYRTLGPPFGPNFDSSQVRISPAGTISIIFSDANNGIVSYTVDGFSGSKAITRQLF